MFLQLWSSVRSRGHRAAREPRRRKWAHRPGMDWLDERCLLSAHVVAHFDQGVQVPAGAAGWPRSWLSPSLARSRHRQAAWRRLQARYCLTSRALRRARRTVGRAAPSTRWQARPGDRLVNHADLAESVCEGTHDDGSASRQRGTNGSINGHSFRLEFPPGLARSFGQSLLVSQEQVPGSAHAGQEVDLGDSEATGSPIDETEEAEPFVKNIEKPNATAPTHAPRNGWSRHRNRIRCRSSRTEILERAVDAD